MLTLVYVMLVPLDALQTTCGLTRLLPGHSLASLALSTDVKSSVNLLLGTRRVCVDIGWAVRAPRTQLRLIIISHCHWRKINVRNAARFIHHLVTTIRSAKHIQTTQSIQPNKLLLFSLKTRVCCILCFWNQVPKLQLVHWFKTCQYCIAAIVASLYGFAVCC